MTALGEFLFPDRRFRAHRPWPRAAVDASQWNIAIGELVAGRWSLLDLWGEPGCVHMALFDGGASDVPSRIGIASLPCPDGQYPSVGQFHPPALRLERALRDLVGLEPVGLPDQRPWLDHGTWAIRQPLGARETHSGAPPPYPFLTAEGDGLHQIAVGPVHAGIIEPGHFRFTANGETVIRLEERLGYTHKGIERLLAGAALAAGARIAGRTSGDSSLAYQFAFARAVEAALGIDAPPRAVYLRALMAELERIANHFGDVGAICNDASFVLMHAHCGALREQVLRAADTAFGHRLMRDRIVPGGVAVDPSPEGVAAIRTLIAGARQRFPALVELYDNTASLQDRTVASGILKTDLARQYAAGGYVGRASGRDFDARRMLGYPPYDALAFDVPSLREGDVNARVWIRIREIEQCFALASQLLDMLPDGPIQTDLPKVGEIREGSAVIEGFRGDIFVWLRLDVDGGIARARLRDPSWFQWPLLEAAIEGNIVADFPLCNKSFNCSYSGHDL
jgi:Ni,Fe-hydrogenase III large subunit